MRSSLLLLVAFAASGCIPDEAPPPDKSPYEPAAPVLTCLPNLDGQLDASELRPGLGAQLRLLVNAAGTTRAVDLAGAGGTWDWSADYADDRLAVLEAKPLAGQWFASSFPEATFVAPVDVAGELWGVYRHTDAALELFGMASAVDAPLGSRTLLVYQQPVQLYRFPLKPGASWTATGKVLNGTYHGLPYAGTDTYEFSVDAAGELLLRDLTFSQVLRVRTRVQVTPAVGIPTSRRQVGFLAECYGEVARATSRDNETDTDFTTAAELRRVGL